MKSIGVDNGSVLKRKDLSAEKIGSGKMKFKERLVSGVK